MIIEMIPVGPLQANCIILGCEKTKKAAVVDPGGDADRIMSVIRALGLEVVAIINTHGHADHIAANGRVKAATGAPIMIGERDSGMLTSAARNLSLLGGAYVTSPAADRLLKEGDEIEIGRVKIKVIETPGHTPGGICLLVRDMPDDGPAADKAVNGEPRLITGDTLFAGSVGRTDFPGGSWDELLRSIKEKLLPLGDDIEVYPGHGPATTIGDERESNPFLS